MRLLYSYGIVNAIKHVLLHCLAKRAEHVAPQFYQNSMKFWGLLMSGHMDYLRIQALYPYFKQYTQRNKIDIEMVFHPGQTLKSEIDREYTKQGFIDDHLSTNREIEKMAIKQMNTML